MSWEPPPAPRHRRFAGGFVALGAVLAPVVAIAGTVIGNVISTIDLAGASDLSVLIWGAFVLAPLIFGIVLTSLSRLSPALRGLGLGLIIGWGGSLIIAAGICLALLAAFSGSGFE